MKRKRKYNPKKHLDRIMAGCRFIYDGNDKKQVTALDRFGRDLTPREIEEMNSKPWRWHLKLLIVAKAGDLRRYGDREDVTQQQHKLSDLGDIIDRYQIEVMLDMPAAFTFSHIEWEAKIV